MTPTKPLVLYHRDPDGFCAAFCAWLAYRSRGEFQSVQYGEPAPDCTDRDVRILDFCYPLSELVVMNGQAKSLLVLDHHKTAEAECGHLDYCRFDVRKSGARLAFEHYRADIERLPSNWVVALELLVDYVQDRDLWCWEQPSSREVNAYIGLQPFDFDLWRELFLETAFVDTAILVGSGVVQSQERMAKSICRNAREVELDGHKVLVSNTPTLISEVAGALAEGRPFGVTWSQRDDGQYRYELRSRGDLDVSTIAKNHGGGGHRAAAGFLSKEKLF